jgi:hypothetical protein
MAMKSVSDIKKIMKSTSKLSGSSDDNASDAWSSNGPLHESDASEHDSPMPRSGMSVKKTNLPTKRPRKIPV